MSVAAVLVGVLAALWSLHLETEPQAQLDMVRQQGQVRRVSLVSWEADGNLLVTLRTGSGAALWRVTNRGTLLGRVALPNGAASVAPSPDGAQWAYVAQRDGVTDLYVALRDGSSEQRLTNSRNAESSPVWSPDGSAIAFMSNAAGSMDIWVHELATGVSRQVTKGAEVEATPRWSPRGDSLTFNTRDEGHWQGFAVSAQGGSARRISQRGADEFVTGWLHDGFLLESNAGGHDRVYVAAADGRSRQPLSDSSQVAIQPALSPDAQWVAYTAYQGEATDVWVVALRGGTAIRVTAAVPFTP